MPLLNRVMKSIALVLICSILSFVLNGAQRLPLGISSTLQQHCTDCHDQDTQKGDVRLDRLGEMNDDAYFKILNRIEEQVYLSQMPPKNKQQLTEGSKKDLLKWIRTSYETMGRKSEFRHKLFDPKYGNLVDHDKLFSGEIKTMPFSLPRRWLISPHIFANKIKDTFKLTTEDGIINPIRIPNNIDVGYYDHQVAGGDHLLKMISNADIITDYQLKINKYDAAVKLKALRAEKKALSKDIDRIKSRESELYRKQTKLKIREMAKLDKQIQNHSLKYTVAAPFATIVNKKSAPTPQEVKAAIHHQFELVYGREPNEVEMTACSMVLKKTSSKVGNVGGLKRMLMSILLQPEFLYRQEFGAGPKDRYGRQLLSGEEASYALAYALTDSGPDKSLLEDSKCGKLKTKEDYRRHVERLLSMSSRQVIDPQISKEMLSGYKTSQVVKLRFFRNFFGYSKAYKVFKDNKRFEGGMNSRYDHDTAIRLMINETDLLVDRILNRDKDVFKELLTTDKFFLYHNGSNKTAKSVLSSLKALLNKMNSDFEKMTFEAFWSKYKKDLDIHFDLNHKKRPDQQLKEKIQALMVAMPEGFNPMIYPAKVHRRAIKPVREGMLARNRTNMFNIDHNTWSYVDQQPFKIPNRMGILTHPTWLTAHSLNVSTDPVRRGKWIREKLLAGFIPELPIAVDASIPDDHNKTLRQRLHGKTHVKSCWKCHETMNPLGYAFEMYDDFGRYRSQEELEYPEHIVKQAEDSGPYTRHEYKKVLLDTTGHLSGTGDETLDGDVQNAIDLITRLAKSDRVRQSIIRHAFRYFMGRNEMLSDSRTLIEADEAYLNSGGSFNALIVSLLTSDSFRYRKSL